MAFIFDTGKGETPETIRRQREIAKMLARGGGSRTGDPIGDAIAGLGDALGYRIANAKADKAERAGLASADDAFNPIIAALRGGGGSAEGEVVSDAPSPFVAKPTDPNVGSSVDFARGEAGNDLQEGIKATAQALGMDPVDLATLISYETGGSFDPMQKGPTTQWGQHRGLIQFGEPQAKQYGVNWDDPLGSQLGPDGAIVKYMLASGFKPGMSLLDAYSTINAGAPGRYDASDANNGGAPGTVRDKVEQQMGGHRQKALALLGTAEPSSAAQALEAMTAAPSNDGMTRVAQAMTGGDTMSDASPDISTLLGAAGNPFMSEGRQKIINMLLESEMQKRDPKYRLELDNMRGAIADREGDNRREDERFSFDRKKFETEQALERERFGFDKSKFDAEFGLNVTKAGAEDADRKADNTREDKKVDLDERKFNRENLPEFYDAYVKQEIEAGRQPLGILEYETALKKSGASNVTTNVGSEKEYDKTIGKGFGEQFLELQNAGTSAQQTLSSLDVMEQMMSDPGFYSGTGAGAVAGLKRLGSSLGMDVEGIDSIETFNAMSKKAALDSMGGSLGTGFSNADRDFVTGQVPTLENTAQGNKKLIGIMRKLNERKMQIAELAGQYAEFNEGRIDAGFSRYLKKWADDNPLFPKEEKAVKGDRPTKAMKDYTDEELEAIINGR